MSASASKMPHQNRENTVEPIQQNTRQVLARDEQRKSGLGRWWFASDICPLLAGTLGPLATGFTVCSLTGGWTSIIISDTDGEYVQTETNQSWVIALNAVCLCLGLISNGLSLIPRWTLSAFVVCAIGLSIQCFGLAGLLIAVYFSIQPHKWSTKTKFTQAYYYAIFSSTFSFTTLLCVVLHGLGVVRKYYAKQAKMDINQTALFRQSISLTVYLLLGSAIFACIEGWAFLDALFWAEFTLLTIGLGGEVTTKTTLGRILLLPYAILGLVLVALLVISVQKLMRGGRLHITNQLTERYLKQLQKTLTRDGGPMCPMSNEYTFNLIRRIGPEAEKTCSRIVVTISITATLIILLGGAVVFKIAEADQHWTYGASCYFAYTSLLTIGYGDYVPTSEAGKSFFVVWSLLAVPTLTIVINNSVAALWGTYRSLLLLSLRLFRGRPCQAINTKQPIRREAYTWNSNVPSARKNIDSLESGPMNVAQQALTCVEQDEPSENSRNLTNDACRAALRLHCYLLAEALRNAILDTISEPQKRYTYEKWRNHVHLLRRPTDLAEEQRDRKGRFRTFVEMQQSSTILPRTEAIQWVAQKSPLLCNSEPEWISLMLSSRLTELLCRMDPED
ncbi:hypothetical protein BKA63DRAFT_522672 [Paraphoma chrysanthemicola]|nr:hypothetical protein BKA63DRAFT_522672 [Paraphoma chrysanthemicola]